MTAVVAEKPKVKLSLKPKVGQPSLFSVIIFNDDFTPMEFVVDLLRHVFHMDQEQATMTMLQVHYQGQAICGFYSPKVAAQKVEQVVEAAREEGHPLMCHIGS